MQFDVFQQHVDDWNEFLSPEFLSPEFLSPEFDNLCHQRGNNKFTDNVQFCSDVDSPIECLDDNKFFDDFEFLDDFQFYSDVNLNCC